MAKVEYVESPGIYEYSGIQRIGKSTLMVADLTIKVINPLEGFGYEPDDVFLNFPLYIDGVHCVDNEGMVKILKQARDEKWRNKVFVVDECSQPPLFYARNTKDKLQTELVTSLWQMPKLGCTFLYSSNIGNSVDIQQRDATWFTIMPMKYAKGYDNNGRRDRRMDYIDFRVIAGYELWTSDETFYQPAAVQELFDSFAPIL